MINVTQSFLDTVYNTSRYVKIRGTLKSSNGATTTLNEDDFVSGSISRVSKAVGGNNFRIGDTHIDYLEFSLGIRDNTFSTLIGSTVVLEYGLEVTEGTYEWCKIGTFIINPSGVVRKNKTIQVTADSMLSKADKSIPGISHGKPYDLAKWACSSCGLKLATSRDEFHKFVNSNISIVMPDPNVYDGIKTFRDLLMWIASMTCTFITCNADGKVVFKPYTGVPVWTINPDTVSSKEFADYTMDITNVTMNIEDKYYNLDENASQDNTLDLDENPLFINYVADSLRIESLTAIRDELSKVKFVPFKIEYNGNPAIEAGDWVTYNGKNYLVTSSVFKYKGKSTLQGVGLQKGNTKKQGSTTRGTGGSGGGGGSKVDYLTVRYVNAKKYTIGPGIERIIDFEFEVDGMVVPILSTIITCDMKIAGLVRVFLIYDNVMLTPSYYHYMQVGMNSLSFTYPLAPRDERMTHTLYCYIHAEDGAVGNIDMENVLARLSAWGLVTDGVEWNGRLELSESIPLFTIKAPNSLSMLGVSESVNVSDEIATHRNVTLILKAEQATLSGAAVLRNNALAPYGHDIDYIGSYPNNGAVWTFELPESTTIDLSIHAATGDDRYLDVYIDDVVVADNLLYNTGSWDSGALKQVIKGYSLSAGTHTLGVGKDTGNYSPIVAYAQIKYKEAI